jgi:hypothetical protein
MSYQAISSSIEDRPNTSSIQLMVNQAISAVQKEAAAAAEAAGASHQEVLQQLQGSSSKVAGELAAAKQQLQQLEQEQVGKKSVQVLGVTDAIQGVSSPCLSQLGCILQGRQRHWC